MKWNARRLPTKYIITIICLTSSCPPACFPLNQNVSFSSSFVSDEIKQTGYNQYTQFSTNDDNN